MAKTAVPSIAMTNTTPTHDEIAAHAYQIYLREGCVDGRDLDNWLRAEAELRSRATNGNGHQHSAAPTRAIKQESILPNSVVPPTTPIAQVTRSTTARKNSTKREAAAAK